MSYDNDDERNAREQYQEMADEENVVIASLFYPFNRTSFPTVSLSVVAKREFDDFRGRLRRFSAWRIKTLPRMVIKDVKSLEDWMLEV